MQRIALTGAMYSGKTTLARELTKHGYLHLDFAGQLKSLMSTALGSIGVNVSAEEIEANKKKYRLFLQQFGEVIGYSTDHKYVHNILDQWLPGAPVVFDNVRTAAQWEVLAEAGFKLVMLHVPGGEQRKRAGVDIGVLESMRAHPVEFPLAFSLVDVHMPVDGTVQAWAQYLIDLEV